jgi:hypothetical protein
MCKLLLYDGILIIFKQLVQLLTFWTLSIVLVFYLKQGFGDESDSVLR